MAIVVHCRLIDGLRQYRLWSTTTDRYVTPPVTRYMAYQWVLEDGLRALRQEVELRLQRAEERGTSSMLELLMPDDPKVKHWDLERCTFCSAFHHDYTPIGGTDGELCEICGVQKEYVSHSKPCKTKK